MASSSTLDYSRPFSQVLKEGTKDIHDTISKSEGAKALTSGTLERDEYVRHLIMLWYLYITLENALDARANHPALAPTYNPSVLARAPSISADIAGLLQTTAWASHPLHLSMHPLPQPLLDYIAHIQAIADSDDPTPLLAHSYLRYLGDLSGGQFIKRTVLKSYQLQDQAITSYDFPKPGGPAGQIADQGDILKLKNIFKERMDESITTPEAKKIVFEETKVAYRFNAQLLNLIRPPPVQLNDTPAKGLADALGPSGSPLLGVGVGLFLVHTYLMYAARTNTSLGCNFLSLFANRGLPISA
ncbi:hypothetical protein FS837_011589 [Tulasnella sp. UAMH 9824]|nr:hypothetical protein FS837_011589 [Tulasnella sp. UAMH 9824]